MFPMIFFFFSFSYSAQWKWINFRKNYKLYNMLIQILWIMWVEWIWYFFLIRKQLQLHVNIPEWINMILINLHLSHSHINLSLFNQLIQVKHGACQEEFINQSGRKSFYFSFSLLIFISFLLIKILQQELLVFKVCSLKLLSLLIDLKQL